MKVLTVGGATVDSIAIVDDTRIERMTMRNADNNYLLLEEGRKIEAEEISNHCGGGAINAAVSMARLGADVSTLARLGQDQRADLVLSKLSEEGVSSRWVQRMPDASTGASVLISSHSKDAVVFTYRGANTLLRSEELKEAMFEVDLVYVSSLSNKSADCFPDLVRHARAQGAMVVANPGIRQLTGKTESLMQALANVDLLALNLAEAEALVPAVIAQAGECGPMLNVEACEEVPFLAVHGFVSGGYEMTLAGLVIALSRLGVKYVTVTAGSEGAYIGKAGEITHCPNLPTRVAGTAGAGDAFASTLALFIADHQTIAEAMLAASINAASVIGFPDTQSGLLGREELNARIARIKREHALKTWPFSY